MQAIINTQSTKALQEMAQKLVNDMRPEAGDVLTLVLDRLQATMTETNFIKFCNSL